MVSLRSNGSSWPQIGTQLGRSAKSCKHRMRALEDPNSAANNGGVAKATAAWTSKEVGDKNTNDVRSATDHGAWWCVCLRW